MSKNLTPLWLDLSAGLSVAASHNASRTAQPRASNNDVQIANRAMLVELDTESRRNILLMMALLGHRDRSMDPSKY